MPKPQILPPLKQPEISPNPPQQQRTHSGVRYDPLFADVAFTLCLLGATVEQIASTLHVHRDTFWYWMKTKPEFSARVNEGRLYADARVAHSLYQRAIGYNYDSEQLFFDRATGEVIREPIVMHCPPDVNAAKHWLSLRQRNLWRDTTNIELTGGAGAGQSAPAPVLNILPVRPVNRG